MNVFEINPYLRRTDILLIHSTEAHTVVVPDFELITVLDGKIVLLSGEDAVKLSEGDGLLIYPGFDENIITPYGTASIARIGFDLIYDVHSERIPKEPMAKSETNAETLSLLKSRVPDYVPQLPYTKTTMSKSLPLILSICNNSGDKDYLHSKGLFLQLLSEIWSSAFRNTLKMHGALPLEERIKNYIDSGAAWSLSLEDLAKLFNYDRYYLEKLFIAKYGMGIIAYRNAKRLERARLLLVNNSVGDVAELLGYKSIYSFSRAFKLYFGTAPTKLKADSYN